MDMATILCIPITYLNTSKQKDGGSSEFETKGDTTLPWDAGAFPDHGCDEG